MSAKIHQLAEQNQTVTLMSAAPNSSGTQGGGGSQGGQDFNPAQVVDQEQIVTFIDEGETETSVIPIPTPGRGFLSPAKDSLVNSVVGFLERPREFSNFAWPGTTMRGGLLKYVNLPRDWLSATAIREKLSGFRYLRCNFHVKVQVNAQQMNAGRLFMVWQPFWNQLAKTPASALTISGLTGYPLRTDLDLSEATAFEIVVPYVGNTSHYDLIQGMGANGAVQVYVYSPLTGLSEVDATMWIWASDIDVQLPTGLPVQSISPLSYSGEIQSDDQSFREFQQMTPEPSSSRLAAEKKPGLIARILDIGGRIAMAASGIPTVGPFALAGGAIARGIGKLASLFGWSKPINDSIATQVRPTFLKTMTNYNGTFDGKATALDVDNQTDIPTFIYGTEEDEMSLDYILRRPVFMDAFSFTDTNVANDVLWKWPVDPEACKKVFNSLVGFPTGYSGWEQANNTYLSYFAHLFSAWRGSICYDFKVVKTPFHSGRIKVIYVPGATYATDISTVDVSKCYTKVIDLRLDTNFEICVPYNWYTPFKEIDKKQPSLDNPDSIYQGTPQGMLYVIVVNSLRNPTTVASNIEFIVETRAGEDFQFAVPGITTYSYPCIDNQDTVSELSLIDTYGYRGEIQGDMFENPTNSSVGVNALGYGEVVTSTRQLLKRYMPLDVATFDESTSTITPYYGVPIGTVTTPSTIFARITSLNDTFRWVMSLFRMMSGPMRTSTLCNKPTNVCNATYVMIPAIQWYNPDSQSHVLTGQSQVLWSHLEQAGSTEPVMELEIPFYQPYPMILTNLGAPNELSTEEIFTPTTNFVNTPNNRGTVLLVAGGDAFSTTSWYRHIGERFSFGMLLGPPPTIEGIPTA